MFRNRGEQNLYSALCVDDEGLSLIALSKRLEPSFNKIYTAENGQKGLELFKIHRPDVVITDIKMPEMDGISMVTAIRQIDPHVRVIYMTAYSQTDFLLNAIETGADDYIIKPLSNDKFNKSIEKVLTQLQAEDKESAYHQLVESILDVQENILMVYDGEDFTYCNKAFLDFFNTPSLEEFSQRNSSITNMFFEKEGFFSMAALDPNTNWINYMQQESSEKRLVLMLRRNDLEPRAFAVKVSELYPFLTKRLISFTDITEITIQSKQHEYLASYDSLTKIYNRNKFTELLKMKMDMAKRYQLPLCIIFFDLDHFKNVNDTHGHLVGDDVLKGIASIVGENIRNTDIFARWGGEEFVIITPITSEEQATSLAEKLRGIIASHIFEEAGTITCSFGVTQYRYSDNIEELMDRSDKALYEAKNTGRNKVVTLK